MQNVFAYVMRPHSKHNSIYYTLAFKINLHMLRANTVRVHFGAPHF